MKKSNSSPEKLDRKTVEKNRRMIMKGLCSKLTSLVPPHHFKKQDLSQQDQLDQVALYIKQLKERVEELKAKRSLAMGNKIGTNTNNIRDTTDGSYLVFPVVFELRELGSSLEVTLISGLKKNFVLNEVISVLHDEGADVVSAHFSTIGDKVFHTLHAQVKVSRVGVETSRVYQRLQQLLC